MAWYTDNSIYHHLAYGSVAEASKRRFKSETKPGKQFPRPTQEAEKEHKPFQVVRERKMPPPHLTMHPDYQPVYNKKPHKNLAYKLTEQGKAKNKS